MEHTESQRRWETLERTVAALADELAIFRLIASYGPLVDSATEPARCREAAELWTPDGIYDLGPSAVAKGHAEIAALFEHPIHQTLIREGGAHVMGLPQINLDGDRATAVSCSRVYRADETGFHVWRVAANRWELVRIPVSRAAAPQWRIARRVNRLLHDSAEARELLRL
ncbi:nuclear transport factor 2 family protein [Pandoraea pneumonica]|uniref:nuclear transport factor 2 family protein n=1 Tax=Pandoraea pneumonica TaxID=2508299 RepID=UPI003CF51C99